MSSKTLYRILVADDVDQLTLKVNSEMDHGSSPLGGPCVLNDPPVLMQAMLVPLTGYIDLTQFPPFERGDE